MTAGGSPVAPLHERVHEMTFWEHVDELRRAVIASLVAIAAASIACWFVSGRLLDWTVARTTGTAVFLSPTEALGARVRVTLAGGVLVALPIVAARLWRFIAPGLLSRERSLLGPLVLASVVFFYLGAAFGFFLLVPAMTRVLVGFGTERVTAVLAVGPTLGFVLGMSLACGAVFQLPLVISVLAYAGLVTPRMLLRRWREAILAIFIGSAILTPGDAASSTLLLGVPVTALYFLSVAFAVFVRRARARGDDAAHG